MISAKEMYNVALEAEIEKFSKDKEIVDNWFETGFAEELIKEQAKQGRYMVNIPYPNPRWTGTQWDIVKRKFMSFGYGVAEVDTLRFMVSWSNPKEKKKNA